MARDSEIRKYVDTQLRALNKHAAEAMSKGSVGAVHDVRVASRRLEEPLELCCPHCYGRGANRAVKQLARLRKAFRRVRDLDVIRQSLSGETALKPDELGLLGEQLDARRERAYEQACKDGQRVDLDAVGRAVSQVAEQAEDATGETAEWVIQRLNGLVGERAAAVLSHDPEHAGMQDLHKTRLAMKRLRYTVELEAAVLGAEYEALIECIKSMQDRLGEWNDHLQAARTMMKIARRRKLALDYPDWTIAVLHYAGERIRRSYKLAHAFLREWPICRQVIGDLRRGPAME